MPKVFSTGPTRCQAEKSMLQIIFPTLGYVNAENRPTSLDISNGWWLLPTTAILDFCFRCVVLTSWDRFQKHNKTCREHFLSLPACPASL